MLALYFGVTLNEASAGSSLHGIEAEERKLQFDLVLFDLFLLRMKPI